MQAEVQLERSAIRAVFFDAVGTLIYPHPPVSEVYAQAGRRWGATLGGDEVERRFRAAFRRQDDLDRAAGYRTSPDREQQRWSAIVADVFYDQPHPTGPLEELWQHFSRPDAWACFADVMPTLESLQGQGFILGMASNYDSRLRSVVAGLPELRTCGCLAISGELGWRKPAAQFFAALVAMTGFQANQVLLVGDDYDNDYEGGRAGGLQVLLLDRGGEVGTIPAIRSLEELPALLMRQF